MILCPLMGSPWMNFRITQRFGERLEYYKKYGLNGHNGIDFSPLIPNTKGVMVYAPHDGICRIFSGDAGYGNYVEILGDVMDENGTRRKSTLAHLEKFLMSGRVYRHAGEPIGIMGSTGDSTGIHCHWTFKRADKNGNTLSKNNGFLGALDVSQNTVLWSGKTLV